MQINGARAIYNSAAIGMATAMLATIFVGLFGFYVISNAVRRDIDSRCGYVIASTTMRSGEYLLGKFLGNVALPRHLHRRLHAASRWRCCSCAARRRWSR